MDPFRNAIETGDLDAIETLLADDIVFTSPVVFKPYHGKAIAAALLRGVQRVVEDFHYVRELGDERDHALIFVAKVGGKEVNGCDFLHYNEDGLIDDMMVMVRPLSGATALSEAMGAQFDRIMDDAPS